jgi:hypothetical protein
MPKPNASQSKSPQATSRGEKSIIRYTIGIFTIFSSITWLYTIIYSPFTLAEMFVPSWDPPSVSGPEDIVANMLNFIQFDYLFCWISTAVWLVLLFKDLKDAGVVEKSWVSLCALGLGMVVIFGPGAASGLAWSVREEILASREFVDDEKMR